MRDKECRKLLEVMCRKLGIEKVQWGSFFGSISWLYGAYNLSNGNDALHRTYVIERKIDLLAEKLGYEFNKAMTCEKKSRKEPKL